MKNREKVIILSVMIITTLIALNIHNINAIMPYPTRWASGKKVFPPVSQMPRSHQGLRKKVRFAEEVEEYEYDAIPPERNLLVTGAVDRSYYTKTTGINVPRGGIGRYQYLGIDRVRSPYQSKLESIPVEERLITIGGYVEFPEKTIEQVKALLKELGFKKYSDAIITHISGDIILTIEEKTPPRVKIFEMHTQRRRADQIVTLIGALNEPVRQTTRNPFSATDLNHYYHPHWLMQREPTVGLEE